jgi:hypothetical protein
MTLASTADPHAESKRCTKCGEDRPLTEYYIKRERGRERLASHCKTCHGGITGKWQAGNREKVRALRRGYDAATGSTRRERVRAWQDEHPEITAAHAAVHRALKHGILTRPTTCDACMVDPGHGHDGRSLIEAHHDDYAQPLVVRWLCSSCHKHHHAQG